MFCSDSYSKRARVCFVIFILQLRNGGGSEWVSDLPEVSWLWTNSRPEIDELYLETQVL